MTRFATTGPEGPQLGEDDAANLRTEFNALRADVSEIRTHLIAVLAKMDSDGGITDTDYESTQTPAAMTSSDLTDS